MNDKENDSVNENTTQSTELFIQHMRASAHHSFSRAFHW